MSTHDRTHWVGDDCHPPHEYPVSEVAPEPPLIRVEVTISDFEEGPDGTHYDSVCRAHLTPDQVRDIRHVLYGANRAVWMNQARDADTPTPVG